MALVFPAPAAASAATPAVVVVVVLWSLVCGPRPIAIGTSHAIHGTSLQPGGSSLEAPEPGTALAARGKRVLLLLLLLLTLPDESASIRVRLNSELESNR